MLNCLRKKTPKKCLFIEKNNPPAFLKTLESKCVYKLSKFIKKEAINYLTICRNNFDEYKCVLFVSIKFAD